MAEADAYLQLLIDQIKLIETKQSSVAVEDEEKQQKYAAILTQANAMLNSVKHTIVQLQIAKVNIQYNCETYIILINSIILIIKLNTFCNYSMCMLNIITFRIQQYQ